MICGKILGKSRHADPSTSFVKAACAAISPRGFSVETALTATIFPVGSDIIKRLYMISSRRSQPRPVGWTDKTKALSFSF